MSETDNIPHNHSAGEALIKVYNYIFPKRARRSGVIMRTCVIARALNPTFLGDHPTQTQVAQFVGVSKALYSREEARFRKQFNLRMPTSLPDWAIDNKARAMKSFHAQRTHN